MLESWSSRSKLLLAFLNEKNLTPTTCSPFLTTSNKALAFGSWGVFRSLFGFLYGAFAHPSFAKPNTVTVNRVVPIFANSLEVHGIFEFVMHLKTVLDGFVKSEPANALAVLGCFQSWVIEEDTTAEEDIAVVVKVS